MTNIGVMSGLASRYMKDAITVNVANPCATASILRVNPLIMSQIAYPRVMDGTIRWRLVSGPIHFAIVPYGSGSPLISIAE